MYSIDVLVYGYVVSEEDYPDKAVIIEENAKGDWVYVILKGRVKLIKKTPKGEVTLFNLKEGDIFGEVGLFGKKKGFREASVVADGPVEIGILDKERLAKEFESLSPHLRELIKTLVARLGDTVGQASKLAND